MGSDDAMVLSADIRDSLLGHVRSSPARAGQRDKKGWLKLYTQDARVEDPVGTGTMVGHEGIGRFYDAFIAQTEVNFTQVFAPDIVTRSAKCTASDCRAAVGRWVEITSKLSTGLSVKVEAILVYEVVGSDDGFLISSLNTYWPVAAQFDQVLSQGMLGFRTMVAMSQSLVTNLGLN